MTHPDCRKVGSMQESLRVRIVALEDKYARERFLKVGPFDVNPLSSNIMPVSATTRCCDCLM